MVGLNHTIVASRDKVASAAYLSQVLGLVEPTTFGGYFEVVDVGNGVSLDYMETSDEITAQHYAFLVSEDEFDQIFGRIQEQGITHWADPGCQRENEINHHDDGRGVYFAEPNGHLLEIITRPYGG